MADVELTRREFEDALAEARLDGYVGGFRDGLATLIGVFASSEGAIPEGVELPVELQEAVLAARDLALARREQAGREC